MILRALKVIVVSTAILSACSSIPNVYAPAEKTLRFSGSEPLVNALYHDATGSWNSEPKVIGGKRAAEGDDPWQVALLAKEARSRTVFCGGALIRPGWVLTAAHCVDAGTKPAQVMAYSGAVDLDGGGQLIDIAEIILHPNFRKAKSGHDVALLRLAAPSQQSVIAIGAADQGTGNIVRLTGWGRASSGGGMERYLQEVSLRIIPTDLCNGRTAWNGDVKSDMICAGARPENNYAGSCKGDSGGPISQLLDGERKLVGIVSWGDPYCNVGKPSVYAKAQRFEPWIAACVTGSPVCREREKDAALPRP